MARQQGRGNYFIIVKTINQEITHFLKVIKNNAYRLIVVALSLGACTSPTGRVQTSPTVAAFIPPSPPASPSPRPAASPTLPPPTDLPPTHTPAPTATPTIAPSPTPEPLTTLDFTGVIVPARCVQAAIDRRGDHDYLYTEVRGLLSAADLAVGTFNATMSLIPTHTGCVATYLLVGDPQNADALGRAGFDLMSVATNHIKNCGVVGCGDKAFFDTLDNLRRVGIQTIGAGQNLQDASQPVVVSVHGIRFGFVSLGQIEQTTFAGPDKPGIAVLTPESLRSAIAAARQVSDVVIAMPHWGPEDVASPNYIQRDLAQVAVQAGADLVVGNHTHVVQAVQTIDGVPVFYGLGNFVFDQGLPDHKQGAILRVTFRGAHLAGFDLIPTHVDHDGSVHIAGPLEAAQILGRVEQASQGLGYADPFQYVSTLPVTGTLGLSPQEITRQLFEQYLQFYTSPDLSGEQGRITSFEIQSLAVNSELQTKIQALDVDSIANVVYAVKPVYAPSWLAGNGQRASDGWIRDKSQFVGLRRTGDRYELVILGTTL
jgi:poly-gamma-glutamate capsule biosynthesis protein CapA/YwtB (metallophosphatase superfamily)